MVKDFLRRHRRKLIAFTAVGAGLYYAYQYAASKLREVTDRASDERTAKENLKRRFRQNQQDATLNVMGFLPELADRILDALKVEAITAQLKSVGRSNASGISGLAGEDDTASMRSGFSEITHSQLAASGMAGGGGDRKSKLELWNEVKITSLTRIFSLYYAIALLVLLTRVQLNLIGREAYVASVMSIVVDKSAAEAAAASGGASSNSGGITSYLPASASAYFGLGQNDLNPRIQLRDESEEYRMTFDSPLNRQYMTYVWYLLNRGWVPLVARVRSAVEQVFGRLEVREEVTLAQIRLLTSRVRSIVEFNAAGDDHHDWLPYLLPLQDTDDELEVLIEGGAFEDPSDSSDAEDFSDDDNNNHPHTHPRSSEPVRREVSSELRSLLAETRSELGSQEAALLISRSLDAALHGLIEVRLREVFDGRDRNRVAKMLPVVTREAHLVAAAANTTTSPPSSQPNTFRPPGGGVAATGYGGVDGRIDDEDAAAANDYLAAINAIPELDGFAARLFTSFDPQDVSNMAARASDLAAGF
ncbi:peroxin [Savitreella phatthalungensis]